jgi:hypothetical protein
VAPTQPRAENEFMASDFAMSKPVIVPARREVWYTDGATGFYALRVAESAWPAGSGASAGGGGKLTAAFSKRGRVALVSTTAKAVRKRARLRTYRHRRSLGHGLVRPFPGARRFFTVRGGKVRSVSIAAPRTIARRALLRRYLRAASSA